MFKTGLKRIHKLAEDCKLANAAKDSENYMIAEFGRGLCELVGSGGEGMTPEDEKQLQADFETLRTHKVYGSRFSSYMRAKFLPWFCKLFDGQFVPN